jgi:hypothetical protein
MDVATRSLGAGVGTSPTEVLLAVVARLGVETGIDLWGILVEAGRLRLVGGQEDMLIAAAVDLAERRAAAV